MPHEFRITSPELPDLEVSVKLPDAFKPLFQLTQKDIVMSIARCAKLRDSQDPVPFTFEIIEDGTQN
jgi:hypothetical protein